MAAKYRVAPPPTANQDSQIWGVWYNQIKDVINRIGDSFSWSLLNFTGSNITDIVTRNHNDLQNFQGGGIAQQYHLTSAEHTGLTTSVDTTLHYHSSDRDSANFTGTSWTDLTDGGTTTLHSHTTLATAQSATGTSIDFTGIPATVKRITMTFVGVSFAAAGVARIRIGTGGVLNTTGYIGSLYGLSTTPTISVTALSTAPQGIGGFATSAAASSFEGGIVLTKHDGNTWQATTEGVRVGDAVMQHCSASIALAGPLDIISLVATTSSFDAGTVNILYE